MEHSPPDPKNTRLNTNVNYQLNWIYTLFHLMSFSCIALALHVYKICLANIQWMASEPLRNVTGHTHIWCTCTCPCVRACICKLIVCPYDCYMCVCVCGCCTACVCVLFMCASECVVRGTYSTTTEYSQQRSVAVVVAVVVADGVISFQIPFKNGS